jgi:hypothetical protein
VVCGVILAVILLIVLIYPILTEPFVWFILALNVTYVSTAGIMYIKTSKPTPPKYLEEDGDPSKVKEYFARNTTGYQFQYEGFIFAGIVMLVGIGLLLVTLIPKWVKNSMV